MKKVFLASRFGEFSKIREKLVEEMLYIGIKPIDLNDNAAVPYSSLKRSLQNVRKSDIFILLIGDEYGTIPPNESKSITHLEYIEAVNNNKKIYVFGIGQLYNNEEIEFSTDNNMKEWQEDIMSKWVITKLSNNNSIKSIVYHIIMDIYKEENLTWLDKDTGLMWQVQVETHETLGRHPWKDLIKYKDSLNNHKYGDYNDWRIPTFDELTTLKTQESYPNPNSNYQESFIKKPLLYSMTMEHGRFWSSTSNPTDPHLAYGVYFNRIRKKSNSENGKRPKKDGLYVRCVRLYAYKEAEKEWDTIKSSKNIQILENYIKENPDSKYLTEAKQSIYELCKEEEIYMSNLSIFEQFLELYKKEKTLQTKELFLLEKIQEIKIESEKCEALQKLKETMQYDKKWKVPSNAKDSTKAKKQTKYKITQLLMELLNECK